MTGDALLTPYDHRGCAYGLQARVRKDHHQSAVPESPGPPCLCRTQPSARGRPATLAGGVPSWRLRVVVAPPTCSVSLEDRHGCGEQPSATPCAA